MITGERKKKNLAGTLLTKLLLLSMVVPHAVSESSEYGGVVRTMMSAAYEI